MRVIPQPCEDRDRCGKEQGRGHPRTGWIKVHQAGVDLKPWFCSWTCLTKFSANKAVVTHQARLV